MQRIISHLPPRHMDDWLAIAFLKSLFSDAEVEYVHPQRVPGEYYDDDRICLIDIGGKYDPEKNNFDHHQNLDLSCSLILIWKKYGNFDIEKYPVVKIIDHIDRFGVKEASVKFGFELSKEIDDMRKEILLIDPARYYKDIMKAFIIALNEAKDDYNDFIRVFYRGLEESEGLKLAKEQIKKEREELERKLKNIKIFDIKGLKVVVSFESLAPYHYEVFSQLKADIIVERNKMNPRHTSVIKNTASVKAKSVDLSKLFGVYPKVFIHATGFIVVLDIEIENFDVNDIQNCIG